MTLMQKIVPILLILLIVCIISSSGCLNTNKTNKTWGQKDISLDAIKVSNNITADYYESDNGTIYYYIEGYLQNTNLIDALDVKLKVTFYDSKGNVVAINSTPYLYPKNIPAKGNSSFYVEFPDPDKKIFTYKVEILSARAEY